MYPVREGRKHEGLEGTFSGDNKVLYPAKVLDYSDGCLCANQTRRGSHGMHWHYFLLEQVALVFVFYLFSPRPL